MDALKSFINLINSPPIFFTMAIIFFFLVIRFTYFFTRTPVFLTLLGIFTANFIFGFMDKNFRTIVTTPDNVPIVGMIFLIIFFTWFSLRKAVDNDIRMEKGEPTFEASEAKDKLYTWPNLVYIEFLCLIITSIVLLVWACFLKAPLEAPANPTVSPNPSKAPWYFLGLQEMLVYFDPWIAGVVLPSMIIIGLMAIPYLDRNPKGSGYYSFKDRKWMISGFLFGFLILWIFLIIFGTFLRGPNWNFFGPYEYWDVHKVVPMVNVNLSELIWVKWLGVGLPQNFFVREVFGFVILGLYFGVIPLLLAKTVFKKLYTEMGMIRYSLFIIFLLVFVSLPIKMYLRWLFNLKYIIAIPEYFFNI